MVEQEMTKTKFRRGTEPPVIPDFVTFSIAAPCTDADIVLEIVKQLNLRIDGPLPETLRGLSHPRGCVIFGPASAVLDRITMNPKHGNIGWDQKALQDEGVLRFGQVRKATPAADAPKGFEGLGKKKCDLHFDCATLTNRQRNCLSMKFEYELAITDIARRLDVHHSTVQESLGAAQKKLQRDQNFQRALKRRAARCGSLDESY
jgi:predicted DNA-binding protein (UPF0251 family)